MAIAIAVMATTGAPASAAAPVWNQGWAWGDGGGGQLGNGGHSLSQVPAQIAGDTPILRDIATGRSHTIALDVGGTVWAWGSNSVGQLGVSGLPEALEPVKVANLPEIVQVAANKNSSLALDVTGHVWGWGANDSGQLGNGTFQNGVVSPAPAQVDEVSKIAAGDDHTLAVRDGRVLAWGANGSGQLGIGTPTAPSALPQEAKLPAGLEVVDIAAGLSHSLALGAPDPGRTVWAWGGNQAGQLGDGTFTSQAKPVPIKVAGETANVIDIAAGDEHSLAVTGDTGYAWGRNNLGQLGTGDFTPPVPEAKRVQHLTRAVEIAGGGRFSMARDDDGKVWTWGLNHEGQLGDGTFTLSATPHVVLTNIVKVATSSNSRHATAIEKAP
ncbi:RCC1 domain-containing protein [Nonomuraea solani]|nr:RCC1 domain-containing protein [Nonomuraea solani]